MDVENKSYKVNSSKGASGKLRTMIAKLSAARTGKTSKEKIMLDTGATCSITRLNIAHKLKLDIRPAAGVTIVRAGGKELTVAGQSDMFNYTAKSMEVEEMEEDSGVESEPEAEVEAKVEKPPVGIPRERVNLEDELWSDCGQVTDIPHIDKFPATTRATLFKYGDVFEILLSKVRKLNCKPVHLELDPDIPIPPPATKCRSIPIN